MNRFAPVLIGVSLLVAVTGCTVAPRLAIEADVTALTLYLGDDQNVTLHVTRTGPATAGVTLLVDGLPSGVSATLSPTTLTGSDSNATLTLHAVTTATPTTATVRVRATDGSLADTATFSLDVRSLTVHGTAALSGLSASVTIQGHTTSTAAADGSFTISGLTVPYDAIVYSVAGGWAHEFRGLRSPNPVFDVNAVYPPIAIPPSPTARSTAVTGTVSTPDPVDASHPVVVCIEGVVDPRNGCDLLDSSSSYSMSVYWDASEDPTMRIHALQVRLDSSRLPRGYAYAASSQRTLQDGTPATVDLSLATTGVTTISGSASLAVGYAFVGLGGMVDVAPNLALRLPIAETAVPATYALIVPDLPGASYDIFGLAVQGGMFTEVWRKGRPAGVTDLALPAAAAPSAPADGAAGVTATTPLTATWAGGGALTFIVTPASGSNPTYTVTTQSNSVTLADLVAVGLPLPSAASYTWSVTGSPGYDTGDLAAHYWRSDFMNLLFHDSDGGPGMAADGGYTLAPERSFTTP